jgi:diacylglycerol kinase (ATP)
LAGASPQRAVSVVLTGARRAFDVGRIEAADGTVRHFLCVMSSGFDSSANERANQMSWPSGTALYVRAMLAVLRTFRPIAYRAELDGEAVVDDAMIVSLGNGPAFGGGMLVCAGADMHDGLLDLIWVHSMPRRRLLTVFPKVYSGAHLKHPDVQSRRVATATLDAPGQVAYADGERVAPLPVTVTAVPDGVQVLVPR